MSQKLVLNQYLLKIFLNNASPHTGTDKFYLSLLRSVSGHDARY